MTSLKTAAKETKQGTERERFDWFIERIQTRVAFDWSGERSGEKISCPRWRTF